MSAHIAWVMTVVEIGLVVSVTTTVETVVFVEVNLWRRERTGVPSDVLRRQRFRTLAPYMSHFSTVVALTCFLPRTPDIGRPRIDTKDNFGGMSLHIVLCLLSEFLNGFGLTLCQVHRHFLRTDAKVLFLDHQCFQSVESFLSIRQLNPTLQIVANPG